MAWVQSSTGQPACLGCSSWQQCFPRSLSPSPALGIVPSSLQRAPQVRARMQHCWPGREVAPEWPLPHPALVPRCGPVPASSGPCWAGLCGTATQEAGAGVGGQGTGPEADAWRGILGSLPGLVTVQLGALDRPAWSFCLSVSLCVGVVYCVGSVCELMCLRNVTWV